MYPATLCYSDMNIPQKVSRIIRSLPFLFRSIFIPPSRLSFYAKRYTAVYILPENQYNKRDTPSRVSTGLRRVTINRGIEVRNSRKKRSSSARAGISQENCGGCSTMPGVQRGETRERERDDISEKGQQFTGIHRRRGLRQRGIHGIPTVVPTRIAAMRNSGPRWLLRPRFSFPLLSIPPLSDSSPYFDNGGEIHRDRSPGSIKLFLSFPLLPRPLLTLVLAERISVSAGWMETLERGVEGGQTIKQFPARFDLSNSYGERGKSDGDGSVLYMRGERCNADLRPDVLRLLISHVTKPNTFVIRHIFCNQFIK